MSYGLISDIHGNLEALEAVLAELKDVDAFLCMGDLVGYGADPNACVERIRALPKLICVAGNHDLAAIGGYDPSWFNPFALRAIQWTAEQLSQENKDYLGSLPKTAHADSALLVHGSLPQEMSYITSPNEARMCFDAMPGDLTLIGHTHVTEYYRTRRGSHLPEQTALFSGGTIELKEDVRYIVNPGAIGQPRDRNAAASFATWNVAARTIDVRRIPYDIERAQAKMREAHLPDDLSERLSQGR